MANVELLIQEYQKRKEEFLQTMSKEINGYLTSILEKYNVIAMRWTQYTPYFNDGDPCLFGVHDLRVQFAKDNDDFLAEWETKGKEKIVVREMQCLRDIIPTEIMLAILGDHVEITVTREDVHAEFYEHD